MNPIEESSRSEEAAFEKIYQENMPELFGRHICKIAEFFWTQALAWQKTLSEKKCCENCKYKDSLYVCESCCHNYNDHFEPKPEPSGMKD